MSPETDNKDTDVYRELLTLQQKLHEDQIDTIRKRLGEVCVQLDTVIKTLHELAIQQAKVEQHIESRNNDHIHHISPCSRLSDNMKDIEELQKACDMCREAVNTKLNTNRIASDASEKELTDIINVAAKELKKDMEKALAEHKKDHFSIFQLVIAILASILTGGGIIIAIIKFAF